MVNEAMADNEDGEPGEGVKQYVTENTYILEPEGYGEVTSASTVAIISLFQILLYLIAQIYLFLNTGLKCFLRHCRSWCI